MLNPSEKHIWHIAQSSWRKTLLAENWLQFGHSISIKTCYNNHQGHRECFPSLSLGKFTTCESSSPSQAVHTQGESEGKQTEDKGTLPLVLSPTHLSHLPKFRKTSFAWIAGQSFTRKGMAMYIPSNQSSNFLNRNHNLYRLYKRKKYIERAEYSRIFMEQFSQLSVCLVFLKILSFTLQTKPNFKQFV